MRRVIIESPYAGIPTRANLLRIGVPPGANLLRIGVPPGPNDELPRVARDSAAVVTRNVNYLKAAIRDCILKGEAPFASHMMYPGALNDDDPAERKLGINAGFAWWNAAELIVFYVDLGWSTGMRAALDRVKSLGKPYEERFIGIGAINDAYRLGDMFRDLPLAKPKQESLM